MATRTTAKPDDGVGPEAGHAGLVHGHADYPSADDLDARLAAARGEAAPTVPAPLPAPDPAQQ